jgi:hypothetical protein
MSDKIIIITAPALNIIKIVGGNDCLVHTDFGLNYINIMKK